jgi:pilus assembly protein CpaB
VTISMRTIVTFAVAIFFGIVAVLLTRGYVNRAASGAGGAASGRSVPVVVAAQPVERGIALQPAILKLVNFPAEAAPANAFHSIDEVTGGKDRQRLAMRALVANEPILASNVSGPGGKLNLSGSITDGMRAVSLRSSDVAGVGGFVLPGDRVDVLLTHANGNDASKTVTQVLAENVRVLGVDQSDNDQADKPVVSKAITVEVTPEQAQAISLGQTVGTVSLTLRHVADGSPLTRKMTAVSDLGPAPRKAASGPAAPGIRVVRGTEASRVSLSVAGGLERAATGIPAAVAAP